MALRIPRGYAVNRPYFREVCEGSCAGGSRSHIGQGVATSSVAGAGHFVGRAIRSRGRAESGGRCVQGDLEGVACRGCEVVCRGHQLDLERRTHCLGNGQGMSP